MIHKGFKAAEENVNKATDLVKYAGDSFSHKYRKEMKVTVSQAGQSQNCWGLFCVMICPNLAAAQTAGTVNEPWIFCCMYVKVFQAMLCF